MSTETKDADLAHELLSEMAELLKLSDENVFKIRAFERAAEAVRGKSDLRERARVGTLTELDGIGKGIAQVLTNFFIKDSTAERDTLEAALPAGLRELTQISGLGPKKARALIKELDIHSLGELEYACRESRLLNLPGFGAKLQAKILDGIEELKSHQGQLKLSDALPWSEQLLAQIQKLAPRGLRVEVAGQIRRRLEVVNQLDFLLEAPAGGEAGQKKLQKAADLASRELGVSVPVALHFVSDIHKHWGPQSIQAGAAAAHVDAVLGVAKKKELPPAADEADCYAALGLPYFPPECRETGEEIKLAKTGRFKEGASDELLPENGPRGIQGVFHNHTTRSDGINTLDEMVGEAKRLGFKYIGISDHSQSAYYAQGLKVADLKAQEKEIRELQERHPDIRVFWGVESDILADGALDYDDKTLARFDFVIASIHSRFSMDRAQMTERVLKAVRHPATRFLGHPTGRLLLGRKAFDIDLEKVIHEAAQCDVAIEINSNPARLDVDWRWGPVLRETKVPVAVSPDAHDLQGLTDLRFGVWMARKALLSRTQVVNTQSAREIEAWLKRK